MKYLLEGRLSSRIGQYYTVGLVVEADSFAEANSKGQIFSKTIYLLGMDTFLLESIRADNQPSTMSVLIYMDNRQELQVSDATGGFPEFLRASQLHYWKKGSGEKDKK